MIPAERVALLDRAWTAAAQLYLQELVPRFLPWFQDAVDQLRAHAQQLPPGPVIVPCCGPGHELGPLHALFGGSRAVVGVDLSTGMIELAQQAIGAHAQQQGQGQQGQGQGQQEAAPGVPGAALEAHVGDASSLDRYAPAAAVLSVFGLQQMGAVAPQALASWARCLAPGGVCVVVLWPSKVEQQGPWTDFDQVCLEKAADDGGKPPPAPDAAASAPATEWETKLTEAALSEPGVELLVDALVSHPMEWPSLERFWEVMTYGGPWRARRIAQGDAAVDELWRRMAAKAAAREQQRGGAGGGGGAAGGGEGGGGGAGGGPLRHEPHARLVVLRRQGAGAQQAAL